MNINSSNAALWHSAVTSFTLEWKHVLKHGSLCEFAVVKQLHHRSAVTGIVESKLLWCGPQWCWHEEIAQRTVQTQTNACRHPPSCGVRKWYETVSVYDINMWRDSERERERQNGRGGNAGGRERERWSDAAGGHLFSCAVEQPFHAILFFSFTLFHQLLSSMSLGNTLGWLTT